MPKTREVYLEYSKRDKEFLYTNNLIGGPHYVKDTIAVDIKKKLRVRQSGQQTIKVQRTGEQITYLVTVVA